MGEGWEGVMFPAAQVQNNEVPVNLDRVNQTIADKLGASPPPEPSPIKGSPMHTSFRVGERGRDTHYWAPPAQHRTCGFPAYGAYLG